MKRFVCSTFSELIEVEVSPLTPATAPRNKRWSHTPESHTASARLLGPKRIRTEGSKGNKGFGLVCQPRFRRLHAAKP